MKRWQILLICCFVLLWPMVFSQADDGLIIRVIGLINPDSQMAKQSVTLEAIAPPPIIPDTVTTSDTPILMVDEAKGVFADQDAVEAIARMVWWEARGESDEGQQAVAQVILNRVRSDKFASTVMGVLSQPNQFSPWGNDKYHKVEIDDRCRENTIIALAGGGPLTNDVYYFKSTRLDRSWKNLVEIAVIGNHRFYRNP